MLYAYPSLQRMGDAYAQHIRNKALLSCDGRMNTEALAEYLAEEILQKRRLEWLKNTVDEALGLLSDLERTLIEVAFFGAKKKLRLLTKKKLAASCDLKTWGERTRTRFQTRALEKLKVSLIKAGLTQKRFEEEFLHIELIQKIYRRVLKMEIAQSSVS